MERRVRKISGLLRRSSRLGSSSKCAQSLGAANLEDFTNSQDHNENTLLCNTPCEFEFSYTLGNIPEDKMAINSNSELQNNSNLNTFTSASKKRMRESTWTLRSLDNFMGSPKKKSKHTLEFMSDGTSNVCDGAHESTTKKNKLSLARVFSPATYSGGRRKKSISLKRSSSFEVSSSMTTATDPSLLIVRSRNAQLWQESIANTEELHLWTCEQIKRQEAIYELYCGEKDILRDIHVLQDVYYQPLVQGNILNEDDLNVIFGTVSPLLPLHEDLERKLQEARTPNGSIEDVGNVLLEWIPTLKQPYLFYCSKQLDVKEALLKVSKNKVIFDFFQSCSDLPCCRKLDLLSFLDSPRSKLVKYPLLVSNIKKYTPNDHPDKKLLENVFNDLNVFLREVDDVFGKAKCSHYKNKLHFVEEGSIKEAFNNASSLVCNGTVRTKTGSKCYAFLFDTIFLCARLAMRNGNKVYMVTSKPIILPHMRVTDLDDGEVVRMGGSFRSTLSKGISARHAFRLVNTSIECGNNDSLYGNKTSLCGNKSSLSGNNSLLIQGNDQHDKKQWLNAFRSLKVCVTKSSDMGKGQNDIISKSVPSSTISHNVK